MKKDISKEKLKEFISFIHELNKDIISASGGSLGKVNEGNLAYELWRSFRIAQKQKELFYQIWATAVIDGVAKHHPFTDGNKRTSYILAKIILMSGGMDFEVKYDDAVSYLIKIASGRVPIHETEKWVIKHSISLEEQPNQKIEKFIKYIRDIINHDRQGD